MKKIIFTLAIAVTVVSQAQIMSVTSIEQLPYTAGRDKVAQAVAFSPQGDYLLISTDTKQGLVKWDLATSASTVVTEDEGAGTDVRISADGQQIIYGEVSYKNKRRHQSVKSVDLTNGKRQTLVKATRNLQGYSVEGNTATTVTDGKITLHTLKKGLSPATTCPVLSRHHLKLYITTDGNTTMLAPNGADEHYIWGSLSPDGKRVLYYVSGHGTFVCDINGSHVISMGNLTAPKWWDDNTIIGMDEVDDEYHIVASSIVARTLDGQVQKLTGDDVIATYPQPSQQAGKIAFSTPDGNIYLINVK